MQRHSACTNFDKEGVSAHALVVLSMSASLPCSGLLSLPFVFGTSMDKDTSTNRADGVRLPDVKEKLGPFRNKRSTKSERADMHFKSEACLGVSPRLKLGLLESKRTIQIQIRCCQNHYLAASQVYPEHPISLINIFRKCHFFALTCKILQCLTAQAI